VRGLPTLAFHGINSDSAENYQLIDIESTVRMGFPPGITAQGPEIHVRKGIPPEITSLFTLIQAGKLKACLKSFEL
jgi:hypothetical protein